MRPTTLLCLASLTALAACASGNAGSTSRAPVTQTIGGAGVGRATITTTTEADVMTLPFDADMVFRVLPSLYDSLGVQINTVDPARRMIGNNGFKLRQRLGKAVLSTLIDCGNTQIGPNADSYDVYLSVITTVTPAGAGASTLSTLLEAQARPITYNQAYNRCTTKGTLEQRLADLVTRRLKPS
ncbi:MAG: hypothetical protein LCH84_15405 [Gemmatimonadetes bacterium]|nr:hypothetical protein [Gemmatimonadota bacterium]